jgi:hypothetical protein
MSDRAALDLVVDDEPYGFDFDVRRELRAISRTLASRISPDVWSDVAFAGDFISGLENVTEAEYDLGTLGRDRALHEGNEIMMDENSLWALAE